MTECDDDILMFFYDKEAMRIARSQGGMPWLMAEIGSRLEDSITRANFNEMVDRVLAVYGDRDVAAKALRDGEFRIEPMAP